MRASIVKGILCIEAEGSTEEYALLHWLRASRVVEDFEGSERRYLRDERVGVFYAGTAGGYRTRLEDGVLVSEGFLSRFGDPSSEKVNPTVAEVKK